MAHHKSAKKRIRQNEKKRLQNRHHRTTMRSVVKRFEQAIEEKKTDEAKALLKDTVSIIDRAVSKGVIHKNTASRSVSRLSKKVPRA